MHLERSLLVGRLFAQLFVSRTNRKNNLPNKLSYFKKFSLVYLVVSLSYFIFLNQHIVESLYSLSFADSSSIIMVSLHS